MTLASTDEYECRVGEGGSLFAFIYAFERGHDVPLEKSTVVQSQRVHVAAFVDQLDRGEVPEVKAIQLSLTLTRNNGRRGSSS